MVAATKGSLRVGYRRSRVVVVGVSTGEAARPEEESARADQLSLLPAKADPFQVEAFQALHLLFLPSWMSAILVLVLLLLLLQLVVAIEMVVELGQLQERKQCFLRNLMTRSHCWSLLLFWVHLQCWKFQKEEHSAGTVAVESASSAAVGVEASPKESFGISPALHLFP
uniref:Uncharacterized protein n=1 Tax=Rhizophora mucronata TaxID=61149 RepID=A0A2P2JF40_RHIMU